MSTAKKRTFFGLNIDDPKTPCKLLTTVVGLWLLSAIVLSIIRSFPDNAGEIGDMFGAINALFSGLAFAGIIYTILLQREDLNTQMEELRETRKEFKQQNETLKRQRFENTFFQLLNEQNQILSQMDIRNNTGTVISVGRDCFKTFYNDLTARVTKAKKEFFVKNNRLNRPISNSELILIEKIELPIDKILSLYMTTYNNYENDLSHYFRHLYNAVRFVHDASEITDKRMYMRLIRAQLSSYQQIMLFYNCISDNGNEKFKPLIEQYHLLKRFSHKLLIDRAHRKEYEESAFG